MSTAAPRAALLVALAAGLLAGDAARAANQCTLFADRRHQPVVVVQSDELDYTPRCVRVAAGTVVRFESDFAFHPLLGGTVSGGTATIDPGSPLGPWTNGSAYEVVLDAPAEYPYFCDFHWQAGMFGSVLVVPEVFADGFE